MNNSYEGWHMEQSNNNHHNCLFYIILSGIPVPTSRPYSITMSSYESDGV